MAYLDLAHNVIKTKFILWNKYVIIEYSYFYDKQE